MWRYLAQSVEVHRDLIMLLDVVTDVCHGTLLYVWFDISYRRPPSLRFLPWQRARLSQGASAGTRWEGGAGRFTARLHSGAPGGSSVPHTSVTEPHAKELSPQFTYLSHKTQRSVFHSTSGLYSATCKSCTQSLH